MNTPNPEFRVSGGVPDASLNMYRIEADHGAIDAVHNKNTGIYTISNFDVDPGFRRHGLGKAMLRFALEEARQRQARVIVASIISQQSLDAMRSVFGDNSVMVHDETNYSEEDPDEIVPANAVLWYPLRTTE